MSEATFRQHLNELKSVLGNLTGDIETGALGKINDWYDQVLDVILDFEDTAEDIIDTRNGYDGESLDDEDVVEDEDSASEETDEDSEEETEIEDEEADENMEVDEDEDGEDEEDEEEIFLEATADVTKTITITINPKP